MDVKDLKERIIESKSSWHILLSPEEINFLIELTNFLPENTTLPERRFYLLNDFTKIQTCPVCGKKTIFNKRHKLNSFCSPECANSELGQKITKEKRKKTNIEKYGFENPSQSDEIKEKTKQTCLERYGVKSPSQSDEIREKIKQTTRSHFGVENPLSSEIIRAKYEKTCQEKYGTKYPSQTDSVKGKTKQTCLEHYGVGNPSQNELIKEKRKQIFLEHFEKENPLQSESIKEKIKQNTLNKYGVEYTTQLNDVKKKIKISKRYSRFEIFKNQLKLKYIEPDFSIDDFVNAQMGDELKFKCTRCNEKFIWVLGKTGFEVAKINCPTHSHKTSSKAEQEIYDWLISIGITNIERNKRDWNSERIFEADLYLPDYKLVIEYNGLYWHSNLNKDKNYHFNKWKFFKEQNINCIQIFENEWCEKKEIVGSIVLNYLGKNEKIYARKCSVGEISINEYRKFLNENHLQGYCNAKIRLGLYYENELVEVMSFSKPRFNKKYDWENIRTCTKIGYHVIGGFSKLLNFFKKKYSGSIISYIDSRYFSGNGYILSGFQNIGHSNPNYFYFKRGEFGMYSRIDFQKHKLKNKLEIYDENLSERENMSMNNYLWIYDCGNDILALN